MQKRQDYQSEDLEKQGVQSQTGNSVIKSLHFDENKFFEFKMKKFSLPKNISQNQTEN